jgi:hypothetical protein
VDGDDAVLSVEPFRGVVREPDDQLQMSRLADRRSGTRDRGDDGEGEQGPSSAEQAPNSTPKE